MALITDLDDRTLVEQHRAGDPDAFHRIVVRHHPSLYSNALRRLGDPVAAEDAVQDAFLRAFRNLERFDGDYHLDAWLHRIVTNTCHDIGRRRGRDTRLFDRACTEVEVEVAPADEAFDAMPIEQINEALDSLPESYREVLLLRFVDELSYADVAEKAGITEQNARARVSRGRSMLKGMLTSTSALIVWAIAPLRRQSQLGGAEAEAAHHTATQVHGFATIAASAPAPTQAFNQVSGIIAQVGPTIATAAPAVTSTAPAFGKAAVAVGLAAAAAIPAGVAVDRAREKPLAPAATQVVDQSSAAAPGAPVTVEGPGTKAAPSTDTSVVAAAASPGGPTVMSSPAQTSTETTVASGPTSSTSVLPTTEPAPAKADGTTDAGTQQPAPAPTSPAPAPAEEPPPPAPVAGPPGQLSAAVSVTPAGNRLQLEGPMKLEVDGKVFAGQLSGRLLLAGAGKDAQAPRDVQRSDLYLNLEDGTRLVLGVKGTSTVTTEGDVERHALKLTFALDRGAEFGLADGGELEGTFVVQGGSGDLGLAIPGATKTS